VILRYQSAETKQIKRRRANDCLDGQNNANADIVLGGPNGEYSLLDARKNFSLHGHMYSKHEGIVELKNPSIHRKSLFSKKINIHL